jgi:hypothetical protein
MHEESTLMRGLSRPASTLPKGAVWLPALVWAAAGPLADAQLPDPPELPRELLRTDRAATPVSGQAIEVAPDGDLQAALDAALPGDEIVLSAGAVYTGNFVLPEK